MKLNLMKKSVLIALSTIALNAHAQNFTVQRYGNTDYVNGPDGSYTIQHFENNDYYNGTMRGRIINGTVQHYGNTSYGNFGQ